MEFKQFLKEQDESTLRYIAANELGKEDLIDILDKYFSDDAKKDAEESVKVKEFEEDFHGYYFH